MLNTRKTLQVQKVKNTIKSLIQQTLKEALKA